jgi:outer membrane protein assembly factor BamB
VERPGDPYALDLWITPEGLVVLRREGRIERYDLRTGKLAGLLPVRLAGARFLAPTPEGPVLVSPPGRVALAEPTRGQIVWDHDFDATAVWPLVDGHTLWAFVSERAGDRLYELDVRTGKIRSATRLPEFGSVDVTKADGHLWIGSQNGKVMVVQTPPRDGG